MKTFGEALDNLQDVSSRDGSYSDIHDGLVGEKNFKSQRHNKRLFLDFGITSRWSQQCAKNRGTQDDSNTVSFGIPPGMFW